MEEKIVNIHNTLCTINVKGEDAIAMAKCLIELRTIVEELHNKEKEE